MRLAKCKHCSYECSNAGMRGHLRFKHGIEKASINDFEIIGEIANDPQEEVYPMPQNTLRPYQAPQYKEDPLDLLERQMMQQMRIKNLQVMMNSLNAPQNPVPAQKDTLSEVVTIMDLVDKIQDRAVERAEQGIDPTASMSPEEAMIMDLAKTYLQSRVPQIPIQAQNPNLQIQNQGGTEMGFFGEEFIKKQIKAGKITIEQAKEFLKQKNIVLPDELILAYFEDIKNGG